MTERTGDAAFVGSVPEMYERLMVPLLFAEPATQLAATIGERRPHDVLETAAGTGVLTRRLARLEPTPRLVATDLNVPMLQEARRLAPDAAVTWQVADALALPFRDASYDVVACQFGAMFFPDRVAGYREALRVLRPEGAFVFSVWDRISANPVADVVTSAVGLDFLARTPHGYYEPSQIEADLEAAGFGEVVIEVLGGTSRCTAREGAVAYCQGTPLLGEIDRHPTLTVASATDLAETALRERYGEAEFAARTSWLQISGIRPH